MTISDAKHRSDLHPSDAPGDDMLGGLGYATMSVAALLAESAHRMPERAAIIWGGTATTYGELWDEARAYAGALRARGIGPNDRVAMLVPNVTDFPRIYYAILALGAVAVPIHLLFKSEEIEYVLRDSGAKLLISAAPMLPEAGKAASAVGVPLISVLIPEAMKAQVPVPRLEDEAAVADPIVRYESVNPLAAATVLYTSGTTGRPKGAIGSHLAIIEQVNVSLIDTFPLSKDDVVFGGLPLFHTFGQTSVMNISFRRGSAIVLLPKFDPAEALELMVTHNVTVFTAVPTMYLGLLQAAADDPDRPPLRYAVSGGAALPLAVLEEFRSTFNAPVHEGYGLTETSPTVSFNYVGEEPRPGTVGKPLWGVDAEVADAEVEDRIEFLRAGELGEIVVRGHNLFKGYLGRPEDTAAAIVDGWFRTGDLGTKDESDIITIVDRKKDMIVRNAYNVYPSEVEGVIMRLPQVANAAVFGVPDEQHGQEIHAAVILKADQTLDEAELIAYVNEHLAAYKYPRHVHFVTELPIGASGKILKRELVAQYTRAS